MKEETDMNNDFDFTNSGQQWSNNACCGYVIAAMENCEFSQDEIRRTVVMLHALFDLVPLEVAQRHYEKSQY